jgi:hypothetical protein
MPKTLAELTLRLSREISEIDALAAREIEEAERLRDAQLSAIDDARDILTRYHKALEKAKQVQMDSLQETDEARDREVRSAEDKRSDALAREELDYRAASEKALSKKTETARKAQSKWTQAVDKVKEQPLSEQRRLRRSADDALEQAIEEAREAYNLAIEQARLEHRAAIQDHLVDERLAVEAARRKAERLITGAAIDYQRAMALEETRMRADLARFPEARSAQEAHDRRVAEIRESTERAKDALFRKFTQERRAAG